MRYTDQDNNKVMILLDPDSSISASTSGNIIDRKHFEAMQLIMPIKASTTGLATTNYITMYLMHSDTNAGSGMSTVTAYCTPGQMQAYSGTTGCTLTRVSGTQSTATAIEKTVDLKSLKRYVAVSATVVGATAVYNLSVLAILGDTYGYPVTATT